MPVPTFIERHELRTVGEDEYENIHKVWEWPWARVVPGGFLMAISAAAGYKTIADDFVLDNLQCHFLRGIDSKKPMRLKVTRLSNGKRFVVRSVNILQHGEIMLHASMTFISKSPWNGPANKYASRRKTAFTVDQITLDDLAFGTKPLRPMMKFERMPLTYQGERVFCPRRNQLTEGLSDPNGALEHGIVTSAAQTYPIQTPAGSYEHILGILNLSDYHVLDAPLQLSGITSGIYRIGDHSMTPTPAETKISTSLNHTINFHVHDGFRADDLTYIEVETPWAKDGRAMMTSKIFTKDGVLIATCTQEVCSPVSDVAGVLSAK